MSIVRIWISPIESINFDSLIKKNRRYHCCHIVIIDRWTCQCPDLCHWHLKLNLKKGDLLLSHNSDGKFDFMRDMRCDEITCERDICDWSPHWTIWQWLSVFSILRSSRDECHLLISISIKLSWSFFSSFWQRRTVCDVVVDATQNELTVDSHQIYGWHFFFRFGLDTKQLHSRHLLYAKSVLRLIFGLEYTRGILAEQCRHLSQI